MQLELKFQVLKYGVRLTAETINLLLKPRAVE